MSVMKYEYDYKCYVADDGNYGVDYVLVFDHDEFYKRYPHAWDIIDDVYERSRGEFLLAVMNEDEDALQELSDSDGYEWNVNKLLGK